MQLFEKWQSATEAYNDFYAEAKHLGRAVVDFLKDFSETNDRFHNAILKVFKSDSGGFSILVKEAESVEDYPLVFSFKNDSNGEIWEFIVRDKQEQNKTMRDFTEACERDGSKQLLEKQINKAKEYAMSVVKTIPEVIEKGVKVERNGRMAIEYQNIRLGLKDNWKGEKLPNHWVITGYEKGSENSESLYASPLITKGETLPLNSNEPNSNTKN
ncbi:DUF3519 domain-containing protein [Helicobacter pylori]|uniref:DUF3519 domain-containing protein n=1 Tax=Helicobacter pylori TaxID=210 RepID=UPI00246879CA|nr:DUF3519 domain-containing protein [Helicobacter pylori]